MFTDTREYIASLILSAVSFCVQNSFPEISCNSERCLNVQLINGKIVMCKNIKD